MVEAKRFTQDDLRCSLSSDEPDTRLVACLTRVLHARVARVLLRSGQAGSSNPREEVEELIQEVFVALFDNDARVLRNWDPARGMSFENYVGLVAERRVLSILRHRRRTDKAIPLEDRDLGEVDRFNSMRESGSRTENQELLQLLLRRLEQTLSPASWQIFELRFIYENEIDEISRATGLSPAAIYASVCRLRRQARDLMHGIEADRGVSVALAAGDR